MLFRSYFSADHQKIAIRQGMSEVQTVSATVHEIAHSKLHNQKKIQIASKVIGTGALRRRASMNAS